MGNKKKRFSQYDEINEDFSTQTFEGDMLVPSNFRMLCALFDTSPATILSSFMQTLSCMPDTGNDERRKTALEYFMASGHGQSIYAEEEVRQIFRELDAKRVLYPTVKDREITNEEYNLHSCWSHMYQEYWFRKWYQKSRRKREENPMQKY